eukprot:2067851-Pleurochrysis_carterae.AAC.1
MLTQFTDYTSSVSSIHKQRSAACYGSVYPMPQDRQETFDFFFYCAATVLRHPPGLPGAGLKLVSQFHKIASLSKQK